MANDASAQYLANIPATLAQTAPSIQLFVVKASSLLGGLENIVNDFSGKGSRELIGMVTGYTRTLTRNTIRRTELDSLVPGQTIEIVPLALSNFTLTLKTVMLNEKTLTEVLGYENTYGDKRIEDLILLNRPLVLEEVRYRRRLNADGSDKLSKTIIRYNGCVLRSYPISMDLGGDWQVIQDCEFEVAYCDIQDEDDFSSPYAATSGDAYNSETVGF